MYIGMPAIQGNSSQFILCSNFTLARSNAFVPNYSLCILRKTYGIKFSRVQLLIYSCISNILFYTLIYSTFLNFFWASNWL